MPGISTISDYAAGAVLVEDVQTGVSTTIANPNPYGYSQFGVSVALSSTLLVIGAPTDVVPNGVSAVYVYNAATLALITTLHDPNTPWSGAFGSSVATWGNTVVVGAPTDNISTFTAAGHAYIFTGPSWLPSVLSSPAPATGALFGYSVAINGPTVLVGAPNENVGSVPDAGVAYEFNAGTGYLIRNFTSPWPVSSGGAPWGNTGLGYSVAVVGNDAVIGDPASDGPAHADPVWSGTVFQYNLATGAQTVLTSPHPQYEAMFGWSVALGIGGARLAVGSPFQNASDGADSGEAVLFSTSLGMAETATFTSPAPTHGGGFGWSVAVSAGNLIVGAPGEGQNSNGNTYVFQSPALTLSGGAHPLESEDFGFSVATSGPYVVVGAPNGGSSGGVWVLNTVTNTEIVLTDPSGEGGAYFGYSVSVSGNLVAVGAPTFGTPAHAAIGNVWVFNAATGSVVQNVSMPSAYAANLSIFGFSVALSGSTLLVGAPYYDDFAGIVFACNATTGACGSAFQPTSQPDAFVGYSTAINGTMGIVGAPGLNSSSPAHSSAGGAWILNLQSGITSFALRSPNPGPSGDYGYSVGIDQNAAIVGAPGENASGVDAAGNVYVYTLGPDSLTSTLVSPNPQPDGEFGSAVGVAGITAIVSALGENSSFPHLGFHDDSGNVYGFSLQTDAAYLAFPADDISNNTELGYSVAIANHTVVLGAPLESPQGSDRAGAAYIL
jgi:hypothetical protein